MTPDGDSASGSPPSSADRGVVKAGSIGRIPPDRELDRRIAALALPALGSIAAEPAYSLADTAIVGHLGRVPLDSLAIATTALTMTAWMAIFLTTATTSAVAGLAASRATDRAARSAGAAYLVAAAGGIAVAVAVIVTAPWVAALLGGHQFGAHQLVYSGSVGYLRASAAGLPFLYVSYAGNGHLIGLADTRTPLRIAVTANVLNVALEVLLVYGVHLGLLGSAWGTVTAQIAAAALYAGASWRRARVRPRRPGRAEVAALLRDGHRLSVRTIALGVVPLTTLFPAAAGKYNCPLLRDDLPWIYEDVAAAETSRVLQPGLAACCCPDRRSGCWVSAKRHVPAAAPGKSPRAVFIYLGMSQRIGSRFPRPAKCGFNSYRPCAPLAQAWFLTPP